MAKERTQEALELSEEILRNIELTEIQTQNIILKCLRLARILNDFESVEWLKHEANGFEMNKEGFLTSSAWKAAGRSGRRHFLDMPVSKGEVPKREERAFTQTVAVMEATIQASKERMAVAYDPDISISSQSQYNAVLKNNAGERNSIANTIRDLTEKVEKVKGSIYQYVLNVNYELKFGNITEDIFTRKRIQVDALLKEICPESIQKFVSVYENLKSNNNEDWANAAHSCRRIIKDVADTLFPPSNQPFVKESGKSIKIGEDQYINRLILYIEGKSGSERFNEIVGSHLSFIGERLDSINNAAHKGTHAEVTLAESERYIIYTYLVLGDILSL
jgi:hypothetical protein